MNNIIPEDILKIQKKLVLFKKNSRNYKKYSKILAKHVKKYTLEMRAKSHSRTLDMAKKISQK